MKKVLFLLVVALAFTFTAMAQTESNTGAASGQTTTKAKKSKKGSAATESGQAAMGKEPKAAKEATLTGCLSAQPDSNGNYTLSNGRYKKGVEVTPADKVKEHAGHQVKLTGMWTAEAAGEQPGGGKKKGKKAFEVTNVTHISDTCAKAPGGGTTSEKPEGKTAEGKPKGKKSKGAGEAPPPK
jgi:hypothetical protein